MKKILIGALAILSLAGCGNEKDKEVVVKKNPRYVRYTVAENGVKEYNRVFSGNLISETESKMSFRVDGTIEKKYFKLGDYVKAGQLLAELDSKNYTLEKENATAQFRSAKAGLAQAEAQLKSAEASFINAKNEYSRIEKLYYDDNVSKSDYDAAKANRDVSEAQLAQYAAYKESAEANLKASEMQLAQSELKLSYTKLIAPRDGYIVSEDKEVNETVATGTPAYTISIGNEMKLETFIPENLIGLLKKGEEVQVEVNAVSGKIYRGEIVEIGSSSTAYGNSFPVNIKIIEKDDLLKPGMSGKVSFDFSNDKNNKGETVLPLSALDQDPSDKMYVYTVTDIEDGVGIVKKSIVNIGKTYADGIEVLDGVNPGDYIVTSGVTQIVEGQEVSISSKEEN